VTAEQVAARVVAGDAVQVGEPPRFDHSEAPERPLTFRSLLAPRWPAVVVAATLIVVETLAQQAGPLLVQRAIDDGVRQRSMAVVVGVGIVYAGSVLVGLIAGRGRIRWTGRLGQHLVLDLRLRVFAHVQRLSADFFTEERSGRILSRLTSDIDALTELLQDGLVNLIIQGLTLLLVVGVLFWLNALLALLLVASILPPMAALTLWFRKRSRLRYDVSRDRLATVLAGLQEDVAGFRTVTAFGQAERAASEHRSAVEDLRTSLVDIGRVGSIYAPAVDLIATMGQAIVIVIGGVFVMHGRLTVGVLTAFLLYLASFFQPIQQLVALYDNYQGGQAALGKLSRLLTTPPTVVERTDASALHPVRGQVELRDVSFGYGDGSLVLHELSICIPPGQLVAVMGPTGCGKSTLCKLLTRTHDATSGSVLLDGVDLQAVTLHSLRRQIGIVAQEPFLFSATIRANVAIGRPDATRSEIEAACAIVGLQPLLDRLPAGIDTELAERGSDLSAGERQLVALARLLVAAPRVVILDEATSNLDMESELAVNAALQHVLAGRTAIVVAHRLSSAARADRILVMEDGRLVEDGSHADLLRAGGRYAQMHTLWLSDRVAGP
jgi:ATP-binding cassette subfamily B protein